MYLLCYRIENIYAKIILMIRKYLLLLLILFFLTNCIATAAPTGKLNVFTDLDGAEIYVDSSKVGEVNLVGHVLPVGEHYVKVMYGGKKAYAEIVNILEGQTKTIVADNFKDFKTDAASRGAIDREAARLRESRGDMAFGIYGGSPATGLSYKWWLFEKFGVQVAGFTQQINPSEKDDSIGYRFMYSFADKVYADSNISFYSAIGTGKASYINKEDTEQNIYTNTVEGAFGIEMKIGKESGQQVIYASDGSADSALNMMLQMIVLGILNNTHASIELGAESKTRVYGDPERKNDSLTNMKVSGGLHFYF